MRAAIILLAVGLAVVAAARRPERIVGGSVTSIGNYPFAVALLFSSSGSGNFIQMCGGAIINNRSILSAAHCFANDPNNRWRSRVGSSFGSSGGVVHNTALIIRHPNFERRTLDSDIAVIRVTNAFFFNNNVRAGNVASPTYVIPDNAVVWAIGWGEIEYRGPASEQLRHVQIWTINRVICRNRYSSRSMVITDNMLCSGWLDVGGRDQCQRDSGGPLLHNNNIVGVCSFGHECAHPNYPGVNAFVPRFSNWIVSNA